MGLTNEFLGKQVLPPNMVGLKDMTELLANTKLNLIE